MVFFPTFSTFILMFWLSLSGQLSLPGIYTWRGTQQLSPWDNNQAIKPFPSLGGHSTHHQQGVPPLLLQQHPTPLHPPANWHNKGSSTLHPACPASPRGPTSSHTPPLGTSTPSPLLQPLTHWHPCHGYSQALAPYISRPKSAGWQKSTTRRPCWSSAK